MPLIDVALTETITAWNCAVLWCAAELVHVVPLRSHVPFTMRTSIPHQHQVVAWMRVSLG